MMYLRKFSQTVFNGLIFLPAIALVIQFLDPLLIITPIVDKQLDKWSLPTQNHDTIFDYIIVGAGSAGSILAKRLTENSTIRVLLLEAGGIPSPILSIPALAFLVNTREAFAWNHRTVPQDNAALGLKDRFWPSGKALGGSSAINGLIYIRGNVQGYDLIARRTGDPLWNTENILKFYNKVEHYNGWFDQRSHGQKGDLSIEAPTTVPATKYFLKAGMEMGYPIRDPNLNSFHSEGFAPIESYIKKGFRSDAYHATLNKILTRPNLVVRKYSYVTKLKFHSDYPTKVIGVEYERHGKLYEAYSTKETILSAGALSTPRILMLSGIGPKDHLTEMNIPVRVDLPVGQRLQDKVGALIGPFIVPKGYSFNTDRDVNSSSFYYWLSSGKGLISSGRTEATFAILSERAKREGDTFAPDIHTYLLSHTPLKPEILFGKTFNFNEASVDHLRKAAEEGDAFFQLVTACRGSGIGNVRLKDLNPKSTLLIDPKSLQHPRDLKILVEGIRFAVNLVEKSNAMQKIGAHLYRVPVPGCEHLKYMSDPYYECFARHWTVTAYKYCGTASIGTRDDPEAVIDSRFRVFGTTGLRVVDGSVFRINEVNTNDVTMRMVGEVGAFAIKDTWK